MRCSYLYQSVPHTKRRTDLEIQAARLPNWGGTGLYTQNGGSAALLRFRRSEQPGHVEFLHLNILQ
jgi:hypothetical protein